MAGAILQRHAVQVPQEGIVVFLVGMRINQLWNVRQWMPVMGAMRGMLDELAQPSNPGVLGPSRIYVSGRTIQVQQYWRSLEALEFYARSKDHAHFAAWRAFYRRAKETDAVGVYHETYVVPPRGGDALYVKMPRHGLGSVDIQPSSASAVEPNSSQTDPA